MNIKKNKNYHNYQLIGKQIRARHLAKTHR